MLRFRGGATGEEVCLNIHSPTVKCCVIPVGYGLALWNKMIILQ